MRDFTIDIEIKFGKGKPSGLQLIKAGVGQPFRFAIVNNFLVLQFWWYIKSFLEKSGEGVFCFNFSAYSTEKLTEQKCRRLTIDILAMSNANDMNNLPGRINFINNTIVPATRRITTVFFAFKRFAWKRVWGEEVNEFDYPIDERRIWISKFFEISYSFWVNLDAKPIWAHFSRFSSQWFYPCGNLPWLERYRGLIWG